MNNNNSKLIILNWYKALEQSAEIFFLWNSSDSCQMLQQYWLLENAFPVNTSLQNSVQNMKLIKSLTCNKKSILIKSWEELIQDLAIHSH